MSEKEALRRIDEAKRQGKTELEITHLKLERLPEELFSLADLEILIAHHNRLTDLPKELFSLTRLRCLFLEHNLLTELPGDIAALPNLEILALNHNKFSSFPEALLRARLKELYLTGNPLSILPVEIGRISSLEKLYVGHANLRSLPLEIGNLQHLKALHAPDNRLTALPEKLCSLENLEVLNLSGNRLISIPRSIADLPNLKTVSISKNPLPDAVVEAATNGPTVLSSALDKHSLPGLSLHLSGDISLDILLDALSALEHAFNSFLLFESISDEAVKSSKSLDERNEAVALPEWPVTASAIAARVKPQKRIIVRGARWGQKGALELATRSTRTVALSYLASIINKISAKPSDAIVEPCVAKKTFALKKAGVAKSDIERLISELIEAPAQSIFLFVRRGIILDAKTVR